MPLSISFPMLSSHPDVLLSVLSVALSVMGEKLEVGSGKKIPPGRVLREDPLWAGRDGNFRDGYNFCLY
jgi:hypothetical protein